MDNKHLKGMVWHALHSWSLYYRSHPHTYFHRWRMTSDSSMPKSQFVNGLRSPAASAIRNRSSDWELNPSRRAVEHGKLVKRQKSTVSTLGTKESRLPPIPPS